MDGRQKGRSMVALYKNPNQIVGANGKAPVARIEAASYEEDAAVWARHPVVTVSSAG